MSLNKTYGEQQDAATNALVEGAEFNKVTAHATLNPETVVFPENITPASLADHVNFINDLSGQVEQAGAIIGRNEYANNDQLTTLDASLSFDNFTITTQHHLSQKVGEEQLFGMSTTAVDYQHSQDQTDWLERNRQSNQDLAAKLFS